MKRFLALLLAACATAAFAQLRLIPEDAKRGVLRVVVDMLVEINGERRMMAPGVLIRDPLNMLMLPGALPAEPLTVKFRLDEDGSVRHVWILTREEAEQRDPR